jgi:hypothetical protein
LAYLEFLVLETKVGVHSIRCYVSLFRCQIETEKYHTALAQLYLDEVLAKRALLISFTNPFHAGEATEAAAQGMPSSNKASLDREDYTQLRLKIVNTV